MPYENKAVKEQKQLNQEDFNQHLSKAENTSVMLTMAELEEKHEQIKEILQEIIKRNHLSFLFDSEKDMLIAKLNILAEGVKELDLGVKEWFRSLVEYIDATGVQLLAQMLKINNSVTSLNLGRNNIGDTGAQAIAEMLKINKSITSLDLYDNEIGNAGTQALAEMLKDNKSITKLNLCRNKIGTAEAETLAEILKVNKSIIDLNLGQNNIGDAGAKAFAKILKVNTAITTLQLCRTNMTDAGAKALAKILKVNTAITELYIGEDNIGDAGAKAFAEMLKVNTAITVLYFGWNNISDAGKKYLIQIEKYLARNKALPKKTILENANKSAGVSQSSLTHVNLETKPSHIPEAKDNQEFRQTQLAATESLPSTAKNLYSLETKQNLQPDITFSEFLSSNNSKNILVTKEELDYLKAQITTQSLQITDINSLLDRDPITISQMAAIRDNAIFRSFYTTLFRDLNQTFNAAIVASSEKVQLRLSITSTTVSAGAGAAVTYGMTKIGAEFLKGFPIASVLGTVISKTADFAINRSMMMDMRHISKIAQTQQQDSSVLCRQIARKVTIGLQDELLNSRPSKSKLSALAKQITTKVLEAISGESRTPTERVAVEKAAEIFAFLIIKESKALAEPSTTIVQVVDKICEELGIDQSARSAENVSIHIASITQEAVSPISLSSLTLSPANDAAVIDPKEFLAMQQMMRDLQEQRKRDAAEIEKLKLEVENKESKKPTPKESDAGYGLTQVIKIKPGMTPEEANEAFEVVADKNVKHIIGAIREEIAPHRERLDNIERWQERMDARDARKAKGCAIS